MRKILSVLLAAMLITGTSVTAFGATVSDVKKPMETAVQYIYGEKESFSAEDAKDFYLYLVSGADADRYAEKWCESVEQTVENGTLSGIGNVALVLYDMLLLGKDPTDFGGTDLVALFAETPLNEYDNPYLDMYAADIACAFGLDMLGRQICDRLVSKYTIGKGTDFWGGYGTSPDDLGVFIAAVSNYADDYREYMEDAVTLLKAYNTETGYDNYGVNANSTAYALAAAVCAQDKEMADDAFGKLMLFYNSKTGGFDSEYNDFISTQDAIFGLSHYFCYAEEDKPEPEKPGITQPAEKPSTQVSDKTENKVTNDKEEIKSPATGVSLFVPFAAMLAAGGAMAVSGKRKKQ